MHGDTSLNTFVAEHTKITFKEKGQQLNCKKLLFH